MANNSVELLRSMYEEKFMRVYEVSRWATQKELNERINLIASLYKGARREAVKAILKYIDGEKNVWEIALRMREDGYVVSPEDVIEILDKCRKEGIIRVKTVAKIELPRTEVYAQAAISEAEQVVEQLKPKEAISEEAVSLKRELESIISAIEPTKPQEALPEEMTAVPTTRIIEDTIKLRASGIINSLFNIDKWINAILIATKEGDPVVLFSPKPMEINQASVAAAASVVLATSSKYIEGFGKKPIRRILILAEKGIMVIKSLTSEYLLVGMISRKAKLGIALRDLEWISNEISRLLEAEIA
ncbi:MAG: hypothetical protein ACTSX9_03275 [Candidatus Njordarchaeales archaeon]